MTRPTQREISDWVVATFGDGGTDLRCAARMNEEVVELLTAATSGASPAALAEECADVFICAARLAARVGYVATGTSHVLATLLAGSVAVGMQLVDIVDTLRDLCAAVGEDLDRAVAAKHAKNLARRWVRDGTGCGRHVEGDPTA